VRDAEIDKALERAARVPHEVPAELLERIADSIAPTLQPVRPLPPTWVLSGGLVLISAAVAFLGAARAGFQGVAALGLSARVLIFGTLALLACVAAGQLVGEWIPGSRRRFTPGRLLAMVSVALLGVFTVLFHDYRAEHFVSAGLTCLVTGVLHAVPAALLGWWLLRRGWAVNSVSAGLVAGVLAGLTGVTMLELHCTNFQALHLLVWHTLVVPVCGAGGALAGWALHNRSMEMRRSKGGSVQVTR
jgi:hypothetical protein